MDDKRFSNARASDPTVV